VEDIVGYSQGVRQIRLRQAHNQHNRKTFGKFVEYSETKQ